MSEAIDLEAIKARCEAATPGPWEPVVFELAKSIKTGCALVARGCNRDIVATGPVEYPTDENGDKYNPWDDAEFIAHARQDIPALVAEVERLRATQKQPIVIEVCPRAPGYRQTFHAQIKGQPGLWGAGHTADEAVGAVVRCHYDVTGIQCEFPENTTR